MKAAWWQRALHSLALRITLASVMFGLVVAAGAIAAGYWNLSRQLDRRVATEMQGRRELLERILAETPSVAAVRSQGRFVDLFFGHDTLHLAIKDAQTGKVIAAFSNAATESVTELEHARAQPDVLHAWVTPAGEHFSGWHSSQPIADGHVIKYYLSIDRRQDAALLRSLVETTLLALPLLLAVVAVGAAVVAKTGLAPVLRFNRLAASVGAKSLGQRIAVAGLPSELADMAREFNGMLKRIDEGFQQLEQFSGDLAHEMRTPVATMLGRTQVALSRSRSAAELREAMEGNVEELDRLSVLISDMLFVARADHGVHVIPQETVDLASEAQRVAEYLSLIAEDRGVQIRVIGQARAFPADRLLVQRAITNLLTNAVRHSNSNASVTIELATTDAEAHLSVVNEGSTIAPAHLERVFDRFFRADAARSREAGGSGLGLAIVRSIALAHGGSVAVKSDAGRTEFSMTLPWNPSGG